MDNIEEFYRKNWDDIKRYYFYATTFAESLKSASKWVAEANIQSSPPKYNILDLGTAAGHVPYICKQLGHDCLGLEKANENWMREMADLMDIKRVEYEITPDKKMEFGKFDYILAFNVTFDYKWETKDWKVFVNNLVSNNLNDGGKLFFILNYNYKEQYYINAWQDLGLLQINNRLYFIK
jgi:hypothetical protein